MEKYLYLQVIHMCIQLYPHPPVDSCAAPQQRKVGIIAVIHISTGTYYLLPRYLSLGVIVPYGTRAHARGRGEAWDHGPTPSVVQRKARKTKTSTANRHPTVAAITPPRLDFQRKKRQTKTDNRIQTNPTKEDPQ